MLGSTVCVVKFFNERKFVCKELLTQPTRFDLACVFNNSFLYLKAHCFAVLHVMCMT